MFDMILLHSYILINYEKIVFLWKWREIPIGSIFKQLSIFLRWDIVTIYSIYKFCLQFFTLFPAFVQVIYIGIYHRGLNKSVGPKFQTISNEEGRNVVIMAIKMTKVRMIGIVWTSIVNNLYPYVPTVLFFALLLFQRWDFF